jgi:hypothetical protein
MLRVRIEPPADYVSGPVPAWDCSAEWNETPLEALPFLAAPLPDPYRANQKVDPTRFCCFKVDRGAVIDGENRIKVTLAPPKSGSSSKVTIDYLDIAWPYHP